MTNSVINTQLKLLIKHAEKISRFEKVAQNPTKRLKTLSERLIESDRKPIGIQTEVPGDLVVKQLRKTIRLFRTLTKHQLTFTEVMIHAALPSIYQDDFFAHEVRIKRENHIDELYQYALLCCPRRFGKTYTVSIYAACLLVCVPGTKIIIFSPGKRQSSYIMDLIRKHLKYLQAEHGFVFDPVKRKDNQENLEIQIKEDVRVVMGLPAKEETTRGTGGTCIICEEASSMSGKFFVDVVLPVTGPAITYCICISTIKGNDAEGQQNWYTRLLDLVQPDGKSFFNVFKIFQACQKCIDANIAAECTHNQHDLPWWQDPEKQIMLKHVMEKLGYADSALQELVGIAKN